MSVATETISHLVEELDYEASVLHTRHLDDAGLEELTKLAASCVEKAHTLYNVFGALNNAIPETADEPLATVTELHPAEPQEVPDGSIIA